MNPKPNDAKGFVDSVVQYLRSEGEDSSVLPKVELLLHKISDRSRKEKEADVTSAVALSDREKNRVAGLLTKLAGHQVSILCRVDPSVIAGLKIQMGDWIVDTTLAYQLSKMAEAIRS